MQHQELRLENVTCLSWFTGPAARRAGFVLLVTMMEVRGVKLVFPGGLISLAFKGPNVILGLCRCNCSLTRDKELGTAAG